jgi:hypothetical protein
MTRKDYIKFAAMLKDLRTTSNMMQSNYYGLTTFDNDQLNYLESRTADIFAEDNPNFDRSRFLEACGVES